MESKITKSVYPGIDIGKFLCAFLILFYHYFSEHGSLPGVLGEALSLYAVAVALFMTISGFLLYNKLENIDSREDRWSIVKKQVFRIYRVYLLWSIPYLLLQFYAGIGVLYLLVLFYGKFRGGFSNLPFIQSGLCQCWQSVYC